MKISKTSKSIMQVIAILALVFAVAGAIYYRSLEMFPFVFGVALGAALNVGKLFLLERVVDKCVSMEKQAATNYIRLQYLLRFFLTGIVLAVSAVAPFINLWGTAAGILTLQIASFFAKRLPQEETVAKVES